ncbi:uncharacterized protein I206_101424 [Kwoniella pini CBS 10737]|uniref:Uncharacterized protein n=1 Tax=Kwoniella pini CBS 10737 TaxID=1296096 RepID=A0A1B9HWR2_9TREE|nr:uncharacterized protein I206_06605 [Kwoniella pini CBS 10737]OCF47699.1 hypothetical protein I206_06605 [Kwoniella pini CBS 10737]
MTTIKAGLYIIDHIVDGKLINLKSKDNKRKYVIPTNSEDLINNNNNYNNNQKLKLKNNKDECKNINYLVKIARIAFKNGDSRPFFKTFCLLYEYNKSKNGFSGCFSTNDLNHLNINYNKKEFNQLVSSDKSSMKYIKIYAYLMESLIPIPTARFRLGGSILFNAIPILGSLISTISNLFIYSLTAFRISVPKWLLFIEILFPLFWGSFFALIIPELGALAASRISPSRRAASKFKYWLKLRLILSLDNTNMSKSLNTIFPKIKEDGDMEYHWECNPNLEKEIFGKDLNLKETMRKIRTRQKEVV